VIKFDLGNTAGYKITGAELTVASSAIDETKYDDLDAKIYKIDETWNKRTWTNIFPKINFNVYEDITLSAGSKAKADIKKITDLGLVDGRYVLLAIRNSDPTKNNVLEVTDASLSITYIVPECTTDEGCENGYWCDNKTFTCEKKEGEWCEDQGFGYKCVPVLVGCGNESFVSSYYCDPNFVCCNFKQARCNAFNENSKMYEEVYPCMYKWFLPNWWSDALDHEPIDCFKLEYTQTEPTKACCYLGKEDGITYGYYNNIVIY